MEFKKYEKEFNTLTKYWEALSKHLDKKHLEKFSEELMKFKDHLKDLEL